MTLLRESVLRTVCFHDAWAHAPTLAELVTGLDVGLTVCTNSRDDVRVEIGKMVDEGIIHMTAGRYGLPECLPVIIATMHDRDALQPRKRRAARAAARFIARMKGVRFVALANTMALGNARNASDLDFFIIVRSGTLWTVRLSSAGPLRIMGKLPTAIERPDAVCLSYFKTDSDLDLSPHMLANDDPYFRHWFLSLLPLVDDGIGSALWSSNRTILSRHPFARPWIMPPDLHVSIPYARIGFGALGEQIAEMIQRSWFPQAIRDKQNKGTDVIVTTDALKFHVDDRRAIFKDAYVTNCTNYDVQP